MIAAEETGQVGPPGWAFFIGPDKAGSTWVHNALAAHPSIEVPRGKDLFYFDRFHQRGDEWYLAHFRPTASTRVLGEVCHDYLFHPDAPGRIRRFAPGAQLLICARHPVERAASAYLYLRRQGRLPRSQPFSDAIRDVAELIDHGRYGRHVRRWLDHFPRSQIHVLDFGLLERDPRSFARCLFDAVGAPELALSEALLAPTRAAAVARWQPAATAGKHLAGAIRRARGERLLGPLKSSALVERLLFRAASDLDRPSPSPADHAFVRARLEADTADLDTLFGTDFARRWWGRRE